MGAPGRDAPCERSTTTRAAVSSSSTRSRCEGNAGARDVVVVGSFAGAMSLGFGLEIGDSMLFARPDNRNDVMCAGSHGGRVNMARALEIRPRGALFSDGLDAADVAVATVEAMRARIGDPASTWADGVISAAARAMLAHKDACAQKGGVTMPKAAVEGVKLHYDEAGKGTPLVFVHEFAGDAQSWRLQTAFFARRYRTLAFNARGYPPSDVPEDPDAYSQQQAADDIKGLLDALGIARAHVCGLSMGGLATLHFGLCYPDRAISLVVAGAGYGSDDPEGNRKDVEQVARRFETEGMEKTGEFYAHGPSRVQLLEKDPVGWQEFHDRLCAGSAKGHALTMRGVQMRRPTIYSLEERLTKLEVPTLIVTGDEDEPCLEPALFMKRKIPLAALVVLPKSGHAVNLEEPEAFNRAVLDFLTTVDGGRWTRRRADSLSKSGILPAVASR